MIYTLLWQTNTHQNPYRVLSGSFTKVGLPKPRLLGNLGYLKRWFSDGSRNLVSNQELLRKGINGERTTTCGKVNQPVTQQFIIGLRNDWVKRTGVFIAVLKRLTEVLLSGQILVIDMRGI